MATDQAVLLRAARNAVEYTAKCYNREPVPKSIQLEALGWIEYEGSWIPAAETYHPDVATWDDIEWALYLNFERVRCDEIITFADRDDAEEAAQILAGVYDVPIQRPSSNK